MSAYNRRLIDESWAQSRKTIGIKCVFLSHQKQDAAYTKRIADYLINNGIDVYFDEYDKDLKYVNQNNHPDRVTQAILKGIHSSSHMIVIVSPDTLYSNWVPFEIGFGFDKTELGVLTIKGIKQGSLPTYLKTAKRIRDRWDINIFIQNLTGKSDEELNHANIYEKYSSANHPLYDIMDGIITGES